MMFETMFCTIAFTRVLPLIVSILVILLLVYRNIEYIKDNQVLE